MFSSNVQPKRRIHARPNAWHCTCCEPQGTYRLNGAQITRCPVCGRARPDDSGARRQRAFSPPQGLGDCAPLQRWEDEGGHRIADDTPAGEPDRGKCAPAGLSWSEFLPRFFPGRRRHDLEALQAYAAYRSEGAPAPSREIHQPVAVSQKSGKEATS